MGAQAQGTARVITYESRNDESLDTLGATLFTSGSAKNPGTARVKTYEPDCKILKKGTHTHTCTIRKIAGRLAALDGAVLLFCAIHAEQGSATISSFQGDSVQFSTENVDRN